MFCGPKFKLWLVFLAALLVFQSLSSAQDEDTEGEIVEILSEPEQEEEGASVSQTIEQLLNDEGVRKTNEPHILDNTLGKASLENEEDEVVQTTGGPVIGSTHTLSNGVEASVYYGIPYAAAPIGPLRFRPPVPVTPWTEPKKGTKQIPICYQEMGNIEGMDWVKSFLGRPWTEDCLTLTVWAPKPKVHGAPVLVNMHGGAFVMGSSVMFTDGTAMTSSGIVVVSPSYRLNVFGFFTLGNSVAPGNVGLMDQTLALQWVQKNAAAFGGDPNRVTLIGVSAGGASVGYHLLSPMSKGLFHAAIVMGGGPSNPWAVKEPEKSIQKSNALLASLGCANTNMSLAVDCIHQKDGEEVLELAVASDLLSRQSFMPTVDGEFMAEHPDVYLEAGRIASPVPVIIGTAEYEGSMFLGLKLRNRDGRVFRRQFQDLIRDMDKSLTPLQVKALDVLYTNWSNPDDPFLLRDAARDLYGDYHIACGVSKLTEGLAGAGSNVYRYVFGQSFGSFGPMQMSSWMGATHGSEFLPILGELMIDVQNVENQVVAEEFRRVAEEFRRRIVNFVKTKNPNQKSDGSTEEVPWPQYDPRNGRYLHVAVSLSVKTKPRARECRMLEELLPALASVNKDC